MCFLMISKYNIVHRNYCNPLNFQQIIYGFVLILVEKIVIDYYLTLYDLRTTFHISFRFAN